ncbi:GNAT family N-acetyltransferase [Amycolatopsis sp. FDAARGOS 1241]|uniref:GNAT family N-acetyltransferase n=1 Tax=Amycolatopsis sp. FDAARGOS 1241 TaxID=2778070 RepID=UPI0019517AFB|nr:GNAT family N-acetyltransferase [Amycolatopsis sp. FDAARGOS 1241]QRP46362.1 GNAT family N-acetyltransferase [Amycolatopsis sp. FDAARGOS 1241]
MSALQAYVRTTAPRNRDVERIGPFLATFAHDSDHPMLNYAIPDDGAAPSPAEIAGLTAAYSSRGLLPRLEFFTEAAPALEVLLVTQGYALERRIPLLVCGVSTFVPRPAPTGVTLRTPSSDADLLGLRSTQNVAFGASPEVSDTELAGTRAFGDRAVLAEDTTTGSIIGGGFALEIVHGTSEIAGIAVAEPHRHRGIAAAITAHLTHLVHTRGAPTAFLTPGDLGIATVYRRVGYQPAGECVHLSLTPR